MASGKADVFLTYCTNAILAQKDVPDLQIVQIPPELNVAADYGMIVLKDAPMPATLLAHFILGQEGQSILVEARLRARQRRAEVRGVSCVRSSLSCSS